MHKKKQTKTLYSVKNKVCQTKESALALADPCLKSMDLVQLNKLGFQRFETVVYISQYKEVPIWVVGKACHSEDIDRSFVVYVEVEDSRVLSEEINLSDLLPMEMNKQIYCEDGSYIYDGERFHLQSPTCIMSREECADLWARLYPKYRPQLEADSFVIYCPPVGKINRKIPVYIVAFRDIPYKVEALIIDPITRQASICQYSKSAWQKIRKSDGKTLVMGKVKIAIEQGGFTANVL